MPSASSTAHILLPSLSRAFHKIANLLVGLLVAKNTLPYTALRIVSKVLKVGRNLRGVLLLLSKPPSCTLQKALQ